MATGPLFEGLPSAVCSETQDIVDRALYARREAIGALLLRCESPVERMLLAALWEHWDCRVGPSRLGMSALVEGRSSTGPPRRVVIEPQEVIATERGR